MRRKTAVKGTFYPASEKEIELFIESHLDKIATKKEAKGLILPHAGYIYSAKTAIKALERVYPKDKILMLGPNHTGWGKPFSFTEADLWESVFQNVDIDKELIQDITNKCPLIDIDEQAHLREHSLEVELPLLNYFFYKKLQKNFKIAPLICAGAQLSTLINIAECLGECLKDEKDNLLIISSSDMTHYEPEKEAREKDQRALERILSLNAEDFFTYVEKYNITICGVYPITIMLKLINILYPEAKAELVDYSTSADVTQDKTSVVGYSSVIIYN